MTDTRPAIGAAHVPGGPLLRFIAFLIDVVGFLAAYAIVWVPVLVGSSFDPAAFAATGAAGAVLAVVYMTIMEGTRGATLGKMVCRLRVTMANGSPLQWSAAVLRNVFKLLALLFGLLGMVVTLVTILNSTTAQRLGDRVARTVVVRQMPPTTSPTAPSESRT